MKLAVVTIQLIILLVPVCGTAQEQQIDPIASYTGPFGGASYFQEFAQTFQVSFSGYLHALEVYMASSVSCEFIWYLRDGTSFDPELINISGMPILFSGTALSDTPDWIYDAEPTLLISDINYPIVDGQWLILHLVNCGANWISGWGDLPGEQYIFNGGEWSPAAVPNREFGRAVYVGSTVGEESSSWGFIKALYH